MADKKISALSAATALAGSEVTAVVQGGTTKKATIVQIATYASSTVTLATALVNGNVTGANDIIITNGQNIQSSVGGSTIDFGSVGGEINLQTGGLAYITISALTNETAIYGRVSNTFSSLYGSVVSDSSGMNITDGALISLNAPAINVVGAMNFGLLTTDTVPYIDINNDLVSSLATPTDLNNITGSLSNFQNQINNINLGLNAKASARVLSSANIVIASPGASIDGVAMATSDRVVLNAETAGADNGVYIWNGAAVPMTRATDCSTGGTGSTGVLGMTITIQEGTQADTIWMLSTNAPITIGVTTLAYIKSSNTTYTGSDGITLTGNNFTLNNAYFSGDVTSAVGVLTIGALKVTNGMIANTTIDLTTKVTGVLPSLNGGTGVANSFTITLAGNLITTGAFNTTFAQQSTGTHTLPFSSAFIAGSTVALVSGRVPFVTANGLLTDSAQFIYNEATNTMSLPTSVSTGTLILGNVVTGVTRDIMIKKSIAGVTTGIEITNSSATGATNIQFQLNASSFTQINRNNSGIATLFTGTSIPTTEVWSVTQFGAAGVVGAFPILHRGSVLYGLTGNLSGSFGYRQDTTGLRIDTSLVLNTANLNAFTVNGKTALGSNQTATAFLDLSATSVINDNASLRIRTGLTPTGPNDGDIWYDASLKFRSNGVTYDLVGGDNIGFQCSAALGVTISQTKFIRTTDGTLSTTTDTIAVGTRRIVSKSSTISKLYVELTTAPGVGGRTVTVYKNGVATALTTGVFTGATANNTVNSFTVVVGDTISCAIINGGVAPAASAGIVVSVLSIPQ